MNQKIVMMFRRTQKKKSAHISHVFPGWIETKRGHPTLIQQLFCIADDSYGMFLRFEINFINFRPDHGYVARELLRATSKPFGITILSQKVP